MMGVLQTLGGPEDVRRLAPADLPQLAHEARDFLIQAICRSGGHLGSNLGVIELTIALHRVFESPRTPILFDTGHQAYMHKLLTGRYSDFESLRTAGGLSGYPNRAESDHDFIENSHASTALSYADGLSKAFRLSSPGRSVVAVVGDGSLTGGLAWEALNNIGQAGLPIVIVLNDNGRSYAPTAGSLPAHLTRLRDRVRYADVVGLLGGRSDRSRSGAGAASADTNGPAPRGPRAVPRTLSGSLFEAMGLGYLGPIDGHDIPAMEQALRAAAAMGRPVVVHCVTRKGLGYRPAESDEEDRLHAVGVLDVATGRPLGAKKRTWTDVFAGAMLEIGGADPRIVALSAAMVGPTGLRQFGRRFPDRCFDTGIAEQHAVASAAGLATAGCHPVVAVYATFVNRAFDQALLDVGLHRMPVTFVLDRAGITGPDGPSHHGLWDLAVLGSVPGMRIAAPRDAGQLVEELTEALADSSGPTALRYPKATVGAEIHASVRIRGVDVLSGDPLGGDVLLVAVGAMAEPCQAAADDLRAAGLTVTVIDPRWVIPVSPVVASLAGRHQLVVTVEDGTRVGGVGSRVAQLLAEADIDTMVRVLGVANEFVPHGTRVDLLHRYGLDATGISATARAALGDTVVAARVAEGHLVGGRR